MPPYLLFIHLIIFIIMDVSNLINGATSGASVGSQFGKTGTILGSVAGGVLGAFSGSRDDKAYERAKELAQLNNQMQREMVEDSAMLQKTGMKKAGISVASLNGGFNPVNSPNASLPSFSTDAQIQSATTQGASALASLLQSNPVAEAQKEALDSQRDLNKAQIPKVEEEKQNIANANEFWQQSKGTLLNQIKATYDETVARKDLTQAQKDKALKEKEQIEKSIQQIDFNMDITRKVTNAQLAKTKQEIAESISRTKLNKALKSEAESRTILNNINAGFARLGLGGSDSVSALLRIASVAPQTFDKLKESFTEMVNKVNPLAVSATDKLLKGIKEISDFFQDKNNKFFDSIYNGHYEMVNGKMKWIDKK